MKITSPEEAKGLLDQYSAFIPDEWYAMLEDVQLGVRNSVTIPDSEVKKWTVLQKRGAGEE